MSTQISPLAGQPAQAAHLVDVSKLVDAYYSRRPDPAVPAQRVAFGTSGHRGSSFDANFNEAHVLAISQAICLYRQGQGIDGPLFIGIDTHALSVPAFESALEVLADNNVEVLIAQGGEYTPTPAVSHAILVYNRGRKTRAGRRHRGDAFAQSARQRRLKYNPPNGGPADTGVTGWIEAKANALLEGGLKDVRRIPFDQARRAASTREHDFLGAYVGDLGSVIDLDAIRGSGIRMGVDPLGGAGVHYWARIAERYKLDLTVVSDEVDPTFGFMTLDWDGRIRMDPSSAYAMRRLIGLKDRYDIAFACDTDYDRHGIVTPSAGLLPPNHYLAVAIDYLFRNRPRWNKDAAVGKTVVSSAMIDRVSARLGRKLYEVPVGFKWFVDGLLDGALGFGGEESAGPRSCAATERYGQPTRMASCRRCCPLRSPRGPAAIPESCIAISPATLANRRPAASRRRPRPSRSRSWRNSRRSRCTLQNWAANESTTCSTAHRETTHRSAASRWSPQAAGSPRGRPAPRTSTRSTRRVSAARTICASSCARRRASSTVRWWTIDASGSRWSRPRM